MTTLNTAMNSPTGTPQFAPFIEYESNQLVYRDGRVYADVEEFDLYGGGKGLQIFTWSSHYPGQGHTVQALTWLRQRYATIAAHGVGTVDIIDGEPVGDISTMYWQHMRSKGLVDALFDDNSVEIGPDNLPVKPEPVMHL